MILPHDWIRHHHVDAVVLLLQLRPCLLLSAWTTLTIDNQLMCLFASVLDLIVVVWVAMAAVAAATVALIDSFVASAVWLFAAGSAAAAAAGAQNERP